MWQAEHGGACAAGSTLQWLPPAVPAVLAVPPLEGPAAAPSDADIDADIDWLCSILPGGEEPAAAAVKAAPPAVELPMPYPLLAPAPMHRLAAAYAEARRRLHRRQQQQRQKLVAALLPAAAPLQAQEAAWQLAHHELVLPMGWPHQLVHPGAQRQESTVVQPQPQSSSLQSTASLTGPLLTPPLCSLRGVPSPPGPPAAEPALGVVHPWPAGGPHLPTQGSTNLGPRSEVGSPLAALPPQRPQAPALQAPPRWPPVADESPSGAQPPAAASLTTGSNGAASGDATACSGGGADATQPAPAGQRSWGKRYSSEELERLRERDPRRWARILSNRKSVERHRAAKRAAAEGLAGGPRKAAAVGKPLARAVNAELRERERLEERLQRLEEESRALRAQLQARQGSGPK